MRSYTKMENGADLHGIIDGMNSISNPQLGDLEKEQVVVLQRVLKTLEGAGITADIEVEGIKISINSGKALRKERDENPKLWRMKFNFQYVFPELHEGIEWENVKAALEKDAEALEKLDILNENGHDMTVFEEKDGEYVFASAWKSILQISKEHQVVSFGGSVDKYISTFGAPTYCDKNKPSAKKILKSLKAELLTPELYEKFRKVSNGVYGASWLKTSPADLAYGAMIGNAAHTAGVERTWIVNQPISFRACLKVKNPQITD